MPHERHYHLFGPYLQFDLVLRDDRDYHLSYEKRPFCIVLICIARSAMSMMEVMIPKWLGN